MRSIGFTIRRVPKKRAAGKDRARPAAEKKGPAEAGPLQLGEPRL